MTDRATWALTWTLGLLFFLGSARSAVNADTIDSSVRLTMTLWTSHNGLSVAGSGWTRHCDVNVDGWYVVVATAGHVLDIDAIASDSGLSDVTDVDCVVDYPDGQSIHANRSALRLDRVHDYGEITFVSPVPRPVLSEATSLPCPGAALTAVASPPDIADFGVFSGHLVVRSPGAITNTPDGAWLATLPVAPGSSGGPVMDQDGNVVAFIDGYVKWAWGGQLAVLVPLPQAPEMVPAASMMHAASSILDLHTPLLALIASLVGSALTFLGIPFLMRRPAVSLELLQMAAFVCEKAATAVEQSHGDMSGEQKKALALQIAQELLAQLHLNVPVQLLDAAIEAAVLLINTVSHGATTTMLHYDNGGSLITPPKPEAP